MSDLVIVCSNRPRPSVQNNHSKGHQYWAREVSHLEEAGQHYSTGKRTLCGRDSTDWLTVGPMTADFLEAFECCARCKKAASRSKP